MIYIYIYIRWRILEIRARKMSRQTEKISWKELWMRMSVECNFKIKYDKQLVLIRGRKTFFLSLSN